MAKKETAKLRQQKAQLLLMQTMKSQCLKNKLDPDAKSPYRRLINYIGPPEGLIPMLGNPSDVSPFVYATPAMLGHLVPMIEFYYSDGKKDASSGDKRADQKILFSDYISVGDRTHKFGTGPRAFTPEGARAEENRRRSDALQSVKTLGTGVGLKEFTWTFDNKHEGDKTIKASASLFFSSVRELLNESFLKFLFVHNPADLQGPQPPSEDVSVIGNGILSDSEEEERKKIAWELATAYDLMGNKGLINSSKRKAFGGGSSAAYRKIFGLSAPTATGEDPKLFTQQGRPARRFTVLKAKVGWAVPLGAVKPDGMTANKWQSFVKAIQGTQKIIALNLVSYKLNFLQEGQVELNIEYVGSLDSLLASDYVSNVLSDSDDKQPLTSRRISLDKMSRDGFAWANDYWADTAYKGPGLIPKKDGSGVSEWQPSKRVHTGRGRTRMSKPKRHEVQGIIQKRISTSGGDTFSISLDEVEFEEKILQLHLEYVEKYHNDEPKLKEKLEEGITTAIGIKKIINSKIRTAKYSKFMNNLYNNRKLYYATVEKKAFKDPKDKTKKKKKTGLAAKLAGAASKVRGFFGAGSNQKQKQKAKMRQALTDAAAKEAGKEKSTQNVLDPLSSSEQSPDAKESEEMVNLFYFKLGDILEESLNGMHKILGMEPKIFLGSFAPMAYGIPGTSATDYWAVADIPVSVDYFGQWFLDNFVQSEPAVEKISFRSFSDKFLNGLVAPVINDAYSTSKKTRMAFSMNSVISSVDFAPGEVVSRVKLGEAAKKQGTLNSDVATAINNYFCIFMEQTRPSLTDNPNIDIPNGIYHFTLGSDRGLVKTFTFSEKKMPQLRALNIENNQQGSALILPQDLELTMYGNTLFRNGQLLYVNADITVGQEVATKLGLGGYYMVVKSENSIAMDKFETRLTCMWQKRPTRGTMIGQGEGD